MSVLRQHKPSPLMAIHLHSLAIKEVTQEGQCRFQRFHQILQGPTAQVPPVVDHLIFEASVLTFVSFVEDAVAGVRVTSTTSQAVEAIDVRVHRDTGLEIYSHPSKSSAVLVEIFLPVAFALQVIEARGCGQIVLEDRTLVVNDPYADIHIHQAGECKVFVTSNTDLNVNSFTLEPHGGVIQFTAPTVTVRDRFHAKITAVGSLYCIAGKLKAPLIKMETAGFGKIQIQAAEIEAMAMLSATAVGESSIKINTEYFRGDQFSFTTSGEGTIDVISQKELHANYVNASAEGCSETSFASKNALANVTRISVAGKATVDTRDILAREANVHVSGAGTVLFRASEAAHTDSNGYGTATLTGTLPARITGRPTPSPELPLLIDTLIPSPIHTVAVPSRGDAFHAQPPPSGFLMAMKSLWTSSSAQDEPDARP